MNRISSMSVLMQMDVIIIVVGLIRLAITANGTLLQSTYYSCVSNVPCKCTRDTDFRLFVDCSGMSLKEIPRLPNDTVFLSLSNNEISVVENRSFSDLPLLLSLDLSKNAIYKIHRDGFRRLEKLRWLNLDKNNLSLTGFEPGIFRSLQMLCYLSIQNGNPKRDNSSYPDQIFAGLISLTTLNIDGIPNATFGPGFSKLHNLRILKLSSTECNIGSLSNNTFLHLPFLTFLDISHCLIRMIEPGTFSPLRYLQYLDISANEALGLDGMRNASFGLINSSIAIFKANKLYPTFHLSVELHSAHLEFLYQTNIKEVHLDDNQIELIDSDWGSVCPRSMVNLSMIGNKFSFGLYVFQGVNCTGVKTLYAGYQHQTHLPFSSQDVTKYNEEITLPTYIENYKYDSEGIKIFQDNEQQMWDLKSNWDRSCNHGFTKYLNLSTTEEQNASWPKLNGNNENINNAEVSGTDSVFSNIGFPIIPPPNMEELHFQFANLRYEIPALNFRNSSLTYINVSGNSFYRLIGPLLGLDKLKTLDISYNLCSHISDKFLGSLTKLESLFLENNVLGLVLAKDSDGRILGKLNNLKTLVLSNNQITSLPFQIFLGLNSLEHLDISRNFLQTFSIRIDQINLCHLNIGQNLLVSLATNIQNKITSQANTKNVTVDLIDNQFKCDCGTLQFMKWVYNEQSRITFVGYDNYTCNVEDKYQQTFTNLDNLILGLEKRCANYTVAIWILSISFILFAILLIAGIMHRYRWKLRYMYYGIKRKYKGYSGLYESDRDSYQFDAFLSYADTNLRFVKFTLLPKVETEGVHLCIHHRDFQPGEEIAANIANAIHRSRKTVVLLDDDFLSSYWCMYELNMARMESIYSRKGENILLLLVKEELDKSKLPLELLDLIHKETYIELPEILADNDILDICSRLRETIIE